MHASCDEISRKLVAYLGEEAESIARTCEFVQRQPKLTGTAFLVALLSELWQRDRLTLEHLSLSCAELGVEITPQGLDQRFNEHSVEFMKQMLVRGLARFRTGESLGIKLLEQFDNVYVVDSTTVNLPESMREEFPGAGGNAASASMKIQLVFNLGRGQIEQLEFCKGSEPDQGYDGHHAIVSAGALVLMDLGYFVLDTFKRLQACGGYFVSRFQMQTALFTPAGERLDLLTLLQQQTATVSEVAVHMGRSLQHRIPCRLIMVKLPQEMADRRRQKAILNAQKHGRTSDQDYLRLLDWAVFVTNVPQTMLQTAHVPELYRIRWQIELLFKTCKSYFGLEQNSTLRKARRLTEIYARLFAVVLFNFLVSPVRLPLGPGHDCELSIGRAYRTLQHFAAWFAASLHSPNALVIPLRDFYARLTSRAIKPKHKAKPSTIHALELISDLYAWPALIADQALAPELHREALA